jgi:DNA-3-methyladenine glycosylase II
LTRIRKPDNFSFSETLWFLDRELDDVMHKVRDGAVYRLFEDDGRPVLIKISENGDFLEIEPVNSKTFDEKKMSVFINEWFDLSRDIRPFYHLLLKDKELAPLAKKYRGFRIVGIPDLFETLCWCVIGQQINLAFAYQVKRRLVETFGQSITHNREKWYLFPKPSVLREKKVEELRALKLTTRKAEYIRGIAEIFDEGLLSKEKLSALDDEELMISELIKIRGIGEWTANYALMKSLRAMNRVPFGDSGINGALLRLKSIPKKNNRRQVEEVFDRFEGWKTYLVFYLWRSNREKMA